MQNTPAEQELRFFSWAAANPEHAEAILKSLPRDCLTPEGQDIVAQGIPQDVSVEPFLEEEAIDYLRKQLCSLLTREAGRATKTGNTQKVDYIYDQLTNFQKAIDHPPLEDYRSASVSIRPVIPTGIGVIDQQIRGLAKGELGIAFASSGRGKTSLLINFAVNAARQGYIVHYITVADQSKEELVPRIDTCLLGEAWHASFTQEALEERHERAAKDLKGQIWVGDYTDRACTIDDIGRAIREVTSDLMIVDHADDVLSPISHDPTVTRHSLRLIYSTLKQYAVKYQLPIWTASQSDELSWNLNTTSISNMSEAKIGKATGASIILGLSAGEPKRQQPGVMYCTVVKARRAFTERCFSLRYDHARTRIW